MKLFEPLTIRGMTLSNRIVMLPMQVIIGLNNRRARGYYLERAKGGAAAIITAGHSVDIFSSDHAWGQEGAVRALIQRLQPFTREVGEAGARFGVQLWQGNYYPAGIARDNTQAERVAPSAREGLRELTRAEIRDIVSRFAAATCAVREAGFDFIEFHGAHGFLLNQFLSPVDNRRTDEYGGDLEGRMRFGLECVRATRAAVGEDFPLFFRLPAEERREGGLTLDEAKEYAAALQGAGVDVLDVSIGPGRPPEASPPRRYRMGAFAHLAQAVKERVGIPVIAVGRIHRPEVAEDILNRGQADLIGIGRQLIADPFWPQKVGEGRISDIVFCDSCNINCFATTQPRHLPPDAPLCKLNPRVGREWEMPLS